MIQRQSCPRGNQVPFVCRPRTFEVNRPPKTAFVSARRLHESCGISIEEETIQTCSFPWGRGLMKERSLAEMLYHQWEQPGRDQSLPIFNIHPVFNGLSSCGSDVCQIYHVPNPLNYYPQQRCYAFRNLQERIFLRSKTA